MGYLLDLRFVHVHVYFLLGIDQRIYQHAAVLVLCVELQVLDVLQAYLLHIMAVGLVIIFCFEKQERIATVLVFHDTDVGELSDRQ